MNNINVNCVHDFYLYNYNKAFVPHVLNQWQVAWVGIGSNQGLATGWSLRNALRASC